MERRRYTMSCDWEYERCFLLLLDDNPETKISKNILASPLGLAVNIIKRLFDNDFDQLKDELDQIKLFAAGMNRAHQLQTSNPLASYCSYMFSFQQFFNSSYRARQGKVLEAMIHDILKTYCNCNMVSQSPKETKKFLGDLFQSGGPRFDADAVGIDSNNKKALIMQIRSRDDTGGTTAKGSLVDLLRELLRINYPPIMPVSYLIGVWEPRESNQRNSTIDKIYSSLQDFLKIDKDKFFKQIDQGIKVRKNISLTLAYGTNAITKFLYSWSSNKNKEILNSITNITHKIENWDDLWIAYAVASLELGTVCLNKTSNISLLNTKFEKVGIPFDYDSYESLVKSINNIANSIIRLWSENSIPLKSPADQLYYIRDLLFLKACYANLSF